VVKMVEGSRRGTKGTVNEIPASKGQTSNREGGRYPFPSRPGSLGRCDEGPETENEFTAF